MALTIASLPPSPSQGVKEFKCEVCGREFTLQANMKRHMLIHTSVRPYQCHICFKTFVQKQTLKTHMIVHSPVKPFKCKVPGQQAPRRARPRGGLEAAGRWQQKLRPEVARPGRARLYAMHTVGAGWVTQPGLWGDGSGWCGVDLTSC